MKHAPDLQVGDLVEIKYYDPQNPSDQWFGLALVSSWYARSYVNEKDGYWLFIDPSRGDNREFSCSYDRIRKLS